MMDTKNIDIASFDIFDTLLIRLCSKPQMVWNILEKKEHTPGFANDRRTADKIAYQNAVNRNGETNIDEVYQLIPQWTQMKQKELDLEESLIRANPKVLKIWNDLGKAGIKRIITSDMYLPRVFLERILQKNGICGWDSFYLSNEFNATKLSGKMFKIIIKNEKTSPQRMIHIGDNTESDIHVPGVIGINTMFSPKIIDKFFSDVPFSKFIDGRISGTLAYGWEKFKEDNPNYSYWNRLGFVIGGMLGEMYVSWLVKTARSIGKNHLAFVARDGYIWEKICNALYPEIKTSYFYAPRITSIAVLGAIGSDSWAIADRQKYIDEFLKDNDAEKARREYAEYLTQFQIDENTAIVDGCSSGFSAQRLVESALKRKVFSLYLLGMSEMHNAAALYATHSGGLKFQMISEFLFGAPTPPAIGIEKKTPIFNENIGDEERFKIEVSEQIASGAVEGAKALSNAGIHINADDWMNISNEFALHLSEEDCANLKNAKNAFDVQQKQFHNVMWNGFETSMIKLKLFGRKILTIRRFYENGFFKRTLYLFNRIPLISRKNFVYYISKLAK